MSREVDNFRGWLQPNIPNDWGKEKHMKRIRTSTLADIEEAKGRIRKSISAAEMRRFQRFMEE